MTFVNNSAYGASPIFVSRASRSAVASFSQLEADRKVTKVTTEALERAHRPSSAGPVASHIRHQLPLRVKFVNIVYRDLLTFPVMRPFVIFFYHLLPIFLPLVL